MFFQGRGNVYLRELDADLVPGAVKYKICTDTFGFQPTTESWTHTNKCGAVDIEDARGIKTQSVAVTMSLAHVEDKNFALGIFGLVEAPEAADVADPETLPEDIQEGEGYFLGGKDRNRNITGLTISGFASPGPGTPLVEGTDYTLDAVSGLVIFGDVSAFVQPFKTNGYGYTNPQFVSIFTAGQREFALDYEFINKQAANDPGSLELYRVRFDPADNLDFQSEEAQVMSLKGSALADVSRPADAELGQFGRRVL